MLIGISSPLSTQRNKWLWRHYTHDFYERILTVWIFIQDLIKFSLSLRVNNPYYDWLWKELFTLKKIIMLQRVTDAAACRYVAYDSQHYHCSHRTTLGDQQLNWISIFAAPINQKMKIFMVIVNFVEFLTYFVYSLFIVANNGRCVQFCRSLFDEILIFVASCLNRHWYCIREL